MRGEDLAYGERRALEIGVALAADPRILFLDEPTSGLGAEGTARLAELVARAASGTLTLVVIEHDMRFLFGLADRISVIHWGQVIARGTPAELRDNPWVAALGARGGADARASTRIDTYYGETQVLFGVSLDVARGRGRGAARAQRRRQDHDAALDPRAHAARAAGACASTAAT